MPLGSVALDGGPRRVLLRQSLSEDQTELALPVGSLVAFLAVAVIFGVLAAIVPAIRASRMEVLDAIATE